jgi:hypothetical protein
MLMSTNETDLLLHSSPYFTDFDFIRVYLPDGSIAPLPFPLGSTDGACESALLLLKHLAVMSYRTKDVSRRAIDEYIKKDYWSSIDLLEEASNLGVKSTQENAAYLYEKLLNENSDDDDDDGECTTGMMDATSRLHSRSGNAFVYCSYNKNPLDCCMNKKKKMMKEKQRRDVDWTIGFTILGVVCFLTHSLHPLVKIVWTLHIMIYFTLRTSYILLGRFRGVIRLLLHMFHHLYLLRLMS